VLRIALVALLSGACARAGSDATRAGADTGAARTESIDGEASGSAGAAFGACFEPSAPRSCGEFCAERGSSCVARGCGGLTHVEYVDMAACERNTGVLGRNESCEDEVLLGDGQSVARCCCARAGGR
jgi:hypothetical protein